MRQLALSHMTGRSVNGTTTLENYFHYLLKRSRHLLYNPAILLLGRHPREMYTFVHGTDKKVHSSTIPNSPSQETTQIQRDNE